MSDKKYITLEEEQAAGDIDFSEASRRSINKIYLIIQAKLKKISECCEGHPEIKQLIKDWHSKTSIFQEAWDMIYLEKNVDRAQTDPIDDLHFMYKKSGDFDVAAIADMKATLKACNLISSCAQGRAQDTFFTFDYSPYEELSEPLLVKAHDEMYSHLPWSEAGRIAKRRFRNASDPVIIVPTAPTIPIDGDKVSQEMSYLFLRIKQLERQGYNPIELAAIFAAQCWRIQPFMDGNKRISLLGANFILEKNKINRIVIDKSQTKGFIENLKQTVLTRDALPLAKQFGVIIILRINQLMGRILEFEQSKFEEEVMSAIDDEDTSENS